MVAGWRLVSGPALEPLTLAEAKTHARITQTDEGLLRRYIVAGREAAESYLNRGLYTQTWELQLDRWPWGDQIYLPRAAPLQNDPNASPSTAPVIQYYASDGTLTTLSSTLYTVDSVSRPARILRAPDQFWPILQRRRAAVSITYVIGWTSIPAIPERIKQGIRMYVAYLEFDREGLEMQGQAARQAAEACWDDRVLWFDPSGRDGTPSDVFRAWPWDPVIA